MTQRCPTILLIYVAKFTVKCPVIHKQHMRPSHVVINVLRTPILSGPLESDIGTVRDMSEIVTENKVYWLNCGVFLVKSRQFGLTLAQTTRPNWQSLLAGGSVAIQTWSIYKVYT